MISLLRIDNRLIHGQVVEAWLPGPQGLAGGRRGRRGGAQPADPRRDGPGGPARARGAHPPAPGDSLPQPSPPTACGRCSCSGTSPALLEARRLGLPRTRVNLGNVHFTARCGGRSPSRCSSRRGARRSSRSSTTRAGTSRRGGFRPSARSPSRRWWSASGSGRQRADARGLAPRRAGGALGRPAGRRAPRVPPGHVQPPAGRGHRDGPAPGPAAVAGSTWAWCWSCSTWATAIARARPSRRTTRSRPRGTAAAAAAMASQTGGARHAGHLVPGLLLFSGWGGSGAVAGPATGALLGALARTALAAARSTVTSTGRCGRTSGACGRTSGLFGRDRGLRGAGLCGRSLRSPGAPWWRLRGLAWAYPGDGLGGGGHRGAGLARPERGALRGPGAAALSLMTAATLVTRLGERLIGLARHSPAPLGVQLRVFLRSLFLQACWNPQGMQNLGLAYALYPALERLYPDPEQRQRGGAAPPGLLQHPPLRGGGDRGRGALPRGAHRPRRGDARAGDGVQGAP